MNEPGKRRQQESKERSGASIRLSDNAFYAALGLIGLTYVGLIVLLLCADVAYTFRGAHQGIGAWLADNPILKAIGQPEIRNSTILTLISCTMSAILSVWVAIPLGYILARARFPGRHIVDAILDIPIVLPPLVVGLSLLILFQFFPFSAKLGDWLPVPASWSQRTLNSLVVYQVPAVILAQFSVAAAFAVRTMKVTFEQISPRCESVALTLGCTRMQAFSRVALPEASRGVMTALTLAWARALGEFGPLLVFAGATRNKTEVLSTTVFLELSIGNIEGAVAVSLIMVAAAILVLIVTRALGNRRSPFQALTE